MPGNLQSASPSGVLQKMTFTSFQEARVYPMLAQLQHDGTTIRSLITDTVNPPVSLRSWKLAARLTASAVAAFLIFFEAKLAGTMPFYWYDPFAGAPVGSNYDASGALTTGRYSVRFGTDSWSFVVGLSRSDITFSLIQVA
jgi:hypothetical protein